MRDADDHAATVRAFLDNCVPGLTTPDVADAQAALDALVAALARVEHERDEAIEALHWLRSLDDPGNEERRTVTLTQIINRACEALAAIEKDTA